jgi:hypothetical protein
METRTKPRYAKPEYEHEQEKSNEQGLLPSQIAYAIVVKTTLETLPALKTDLEDCFEKHSVTVVFQKASVAYLQIVERPHWTKEEREAHLGLKEEERP